MTGAACGIDAAIARTFADEGAQVIVTHIDADAGQATAETIGGVFVSLDVASEAGWAENERRLCTLDVLVNNAGIPRFEGQFESHPPAHDPENSYLSDWHAGSTVRKG